MRASIRLGRVAGIPIGLHYSWFIIAALITVSLAAHFRATSPAWTPVVVWSSSVVTALLFFASLVAHELSHALVGRANGVPVRSITLFALGGVAQIEKNASSARSEFWMSIAGPITSAAIGIVCVTLAYQLGWTIEGGAPRVVPAILGWLGSINVLLAAFNLIPGYPLDGGRVLRAILWWMSGSAERATRTAAQVGQFVAGVFIVLGLLRFLGGAGINGLWLAFIGWFLLEGARAGEMETIIADSLRGVLVRDVMSHEYGTVDVDLDLRSFVDILLRTGHRCYIAMRDGQMAGLITPAEVRKVPQSQWSSIAIRDAMQPVSRLKTVSPEISVTEALGIMAREDVNQLPVLASGRLVGILTRAHVLRVLQTHAELKV